MEILLGALLIIMMTFPTVLIGIVFHEMNKSDKYESKAMMDLFKLQEIEDKRDNFK